MTSVMEFDHDWYNSLNDPMDMTDEAGLRDEKVSYVPTASLGSTGYIIENRAGSVTLYIRTEILIDLIIGHSHLIMILKSISMKLL